MIEITGLTRYFGGLAAVNRLDFNINQGELVGLIGPNGAGKTTCFNLLTGFLRPTKGRVIFNGHNITGRNPHTIASKGIIRTFQATSVFRDFTVLQNIKIAYYLKSRAGFLESIINTPASQKKEDLISERAREMAQFVGLESVTDVPAKNLPHGYKRMLGIAIAMAAEPKLLLLDEPLSGMNSEEVSNAIEIISNIWRKGTTILLIEHNMRAAMSLCQRLIVLNFGKKIAEGTAEEIRNNKMVIQAYLGSDEDAA
jgi:branched-chain amino acid transport system ATP-binding protein